MEMIEEFNHCRRQHYRVAMILYFDAQLVRMERDLQLRGDVKTAL